MAAVSESCACFYVLNFDCDYSEITRQLGFDPTEASNRRGTSGPEYVSMWRHSIRQPVTDPEKLPRNLADILKTKPAILSDCVESLLTTLELHSDAITSISNQYQTGIHCRGSFGVELTPELLLRLSALGVRFDFACHCCFADLEVSPVA